MVPALVNGAAGVVSILDGQPFAIGSVTVRGGKIVAIDILADPARLRQLDLTVLDLTAAGWAPSSRSDLSPTTTRC